ncbi:hypothetical protein ABTX60_08920 [Streptomyces sp. NPDC126510]|uniref:hypothetical protein n=1 Tax=Streptomyces sp. NPDC126510 TaxID=3155317 RepID=UPI003320C5AC
MSQSGDTAIAGFSAAVLGSVITGRLSGPTTKGYVIWAIQPRVPQEKGSVAHLVVVRLCKWAEGCISGGWKVFTLSSLGETFPGYLATNWVRIAWTS